MNILCILSVLGIKDTLVGRIEIPAFMEFNRPRVSLLLTNKFIYCHKYCKRKNTWC